MHYHCINTPCEHYQDEKSYYPRPLVCIVAGEPITKIASYKQPLIRWIIVEGVKLVFVWVLVWLLH